MNSNTTELYKIIMDVLDTFEHTQLNISSESGRNIVAEEIHDAVHVHITNIVEEIICPDSVPQHLGCTEACDV